MTTVLVLGGGPDAEREISIQSATAVHSACAAAGLDATIRIVDEPTIGDVRSWETDAVFPVLHGRFGEGGKLQTMLDAAAIPYVGSGARASRRAMDKLGTKLEAARLGIPTLPSTILDPDDTEPPLGLPAVIKPVADGSSFGLHLCADRAQWDRAIEAVWSDRAAHRDRVSMVEPMVVGRELTVPMLIDEDGLLVPLPIIEIAPSSGVYDYQAKYERNDTVYTVGPDLPDETGDRLCAWSSELCAALGVKHLARVDYLLTDRGDPVLLEVNTMPGFTASSLLPKAAASRGIGMEALCDRLVRRALERD